MSRPAVLLDRDGTLNEDLPEGVKSLAEFRPIPGAFEAVGRLCRAGWPVAVVTNQSGIGRGWVTAETVDLIHRECARLAAEHGGQFDGFHVCPDPPDSPSPRRKPHPGLLIEAAREHDYDLLRSFMIGDSTRDLIAGRVVGAAPLLVLTGKGRATLAEGTQPRDRTFPDLAGAVEWILSAPKRDVAPSITVVIPAYQEEARIGRSLESVADFLRARGESFEVLVVDDGSRDGTAAIAADFARRNPGFEVMKLPENRGKGAAVREGLAKSRGRLVLFTDADLSTPMEELSLLEGSLRDGGDFILASRAMPESRLEVRQPWYREQMGKAFNAVARVMTGVPFHDTQCGFKLLRGEHARALAGDMREDGFSFDVELILLARRRGLALREVPVRWRNDAGSRVSPGREAIAMFVALLRIVGRLGKYRA